MKKIYSLVFSVAAFGTLGFAQQRIASPGASLQGDIKNNVTAFMAPCDTASNFDLAAHTPAVYTVGAANNCGGNGWGYVAGHNCYDDRGKVDFFTSANGDTIYGAIIFFYAKHDGSGSSTVDVKVWNGASGSPGAVLGSQTVPISAIPAFPTPGLVMFSTPVVVTGNFFLGVQLQPNGTPQDTVSVVTNTIDELIPGTAWEMWDNGTWYAVSDASNSWGINLAHAIFAIRCQGGTSVNDLTKDHVFDIYPNPSTGIVNLKFMNLNPAEKTELKISNVLGEMVYQTEVRSMQSVIDLASQPAGVYYYTITTGNAKSSGKLNIVR